MARVGKYAIPGHEIREVTFIRLHPINIVRLRCHGLRPKAFKIRPKKKLPINVNFQTVLFTVLNECLLRQISIS